MRVRLRLSAIHFCTNDEQLADAKHPLYRLLLSAPRIRRNCGKMYGKIEQASGALTVSRNDDCQPRVSVRQFIESPNLISFFHLTPGIFICFLKTKSDFPENEYCCICNAVFGNLSMYNAHTFGHRSEGSFIVSSRIESRCAKNSTLDWTHRDHIFSNSIYQFITRH